MCLRGSLVARGVEIPALLALKLGPQLGARIRNGWELGCSAQHASGANHRQGVLWSPCLLKVDVATGEPELS